MKVNNKLRANRKDRVVLTLGEKNVHIINLKKSIVLELAELRTIQSWRTDWEFICIVVWKFLLPISTWISATKEIKWFVNLIMLQKVFKSIKIPLVLFLFLREKNYQEKTPISLRLRSFIFIINFLWDQHSAWGSQTVILETNIVTSDIFFVIPRITSFHSESLFDAPMCLFKSTCMYIQFFRDKISKIGAWMNVPIFQTLQ